MNVTEILDVLEELVESSKSVPFSGGKCIIDAERIYDLLNDVRMSLPSEIKQAKLIVADRQQIIDDARRESIQVIAKAEKQAKILLNQQEIIKQAQSKANEMLTQSNSQSKELKLATNEFSDNVLKDLEKTLLENLNNIKSARSKIRTNK